MGGGRSDVVIVSRLVFLHVYVSSLPLSLTHTFIYTHREAARKAEAAENARREREAAELAVCTFQPQVPVGGLMLCVLSV